MRTHGGIKAFSRRIRRDVNLLKTEPAGDYQGMLHQLSPATAANALRFDEQELYLALGRQPAQAIKSGDRASFVEDVEGGFRNALRGDGQRCTACLHEGGVVTPERFGPHRECTELRCLAALSPTNLHDHAPGTLNGDNLRQGKGIKTTRSRFTTHSGALP
jgi:hypothetical protein